MKVVIIEDEKPSRDTLTTLLQQHASIELIGTATSMREGLELLQNQSPDLVFLDIDLGDGTGFDLLSQLPERNFHLVFTTGHNNQALAAFEFGALHYLLKPLTAVRLAEAINRVAKVNGSSEDPRILEEVIRNQRADKLPTRMVIQTTSSNRYVEIKEIVRFEGDGGYTKIFLQEEEKPITTSKNLGAYEKQFALHPEFCRVHKSHLVNLYFVSEFIKTDGGELLLRDGTKRIGVSRVYRDQLDKKLENL